VFFLYEAGEHGGELVYSYAGGVGIRTGEPEDVGRLLIAAAYHQAQADRKAGRPADAAAVIAEVARRHPSDPGIQMLSAESALLDRKSPDEALALLGRITVPSDDARLRVRHAMLTADAHEAAGRPDAARATLQQILAAYPENARLKQRLEALPARP
jgi:tetratricopeptide (TPR) repeat protein